MSVPCGVTDGRSSATAAKVVAGNVYALPPAAARPFQVECFHPS